MTGSWNNVEQAILKVTDGLSCIPNQTLRTKVEETLSLIKRCFHLPFVLFLISDWYQFSLLSPMLTTSSFLQCPCDAVHSVWISGRWILPICPCIHHAGRNYESNRGDTTTSGTVDDDQENAGKHLCHGFIIRSFFHILFWAITCNPHFFFWFLITLCNLTLGLLPRLGIRKQMFQIAKTRGQ